MVSILLSVMNALMVQTKNSSQCHFALFLQIKSVDHLWDIMNLNMVRLVKLYVQLYTNRMLFLNAS